MQISILILEYYIYLAFVVSLILYFYSYYKKLFALIFSFVSEDVLVGKDDWYIRHATTYYADSIL